LLRSYYSRWKISDIHPNRVLGDDVGLDRARLIIEFWLRGFAGVGANLQFASLCNYLGRNSAVVPDVVGTKTRPFLPSSGQIGNGEIWWSDTPSIFLRFNEQPRALGIHVGLSVQQRSFSGFTSGFRLQPYYEASYSRDYYERPIEPLNGCIPFWCFLSIVIYYGSGALITIYGERYVRFSETVGIILALSIAPTWFLGRVLCEKEQDEEKARRHFHSGQIVPRVVS
jgi:hypothetical protein